PEAPRTGATMPRMSIKVRADAAALVGDPYRMGRLAALHADGGPAGTTGEEHRLTDCRGQVPHHGEGDLAPRPGRQSSCAPGTARGRRHLLSSCRAGQRTREGSRLRAGAAVTESRYW